MTTGRASNGTVLANRLAAALVHHEPGWRLPRHTALARRYNVSPAEIENAVAELVSRHLIRRLPDGQLYRASPAEYLIELEGVAGLGSMLDPMGGDLACRSRQVSWRRVPEDIALGPGPAGRRRRDLRGPVPVDGGRRAGRQLDHLPARRPGRPAGRRGRRRCRPASACSRWPCDEPPAPQALHIEMQPPPPAVARSLRLAAGQPATIVTVRFDDPSAPAGGAHRGRAALGPVPRGDPVSAAPAGRRGDSGSYGAAWTHVLED